MDVVQATSDAAKGLLLHAQTGLGGAHHSPDLFHIQHDISKATARPLAMCIKQAEQAIAKELKNKQTFEEARIFFDASKNEGRAGKRPDFEKKIREAEELGKIALAGLHAAQSRQKNAQEAVRGISDAYHPFDIQTGELRSADQVRQDLGQKFSVLRSIAESARLADRSHKQIEKAQRQVDSMVATIAFFHHSVQAHTASLELTSEQAIAFNLYLVPGFYLHWTLDKSAGSELPNPADLR